MIFPSGGVSPCQLALAQALDPADGRVVGGTLVDVAVGEASVGTAVLVAGVVGVEAAFCVSWAATVSATAVEIASSLAAGPQAERNNATVASPAGINLFIFICVPFKVRF
jgi:hypothetical protein